MIVPPRSEMVRSHCIGSRTKSTGLMRNRSRPCTRASRAWPTSPMSWCSGSQLTTTEAGSTARARESAAQFAMRLPLVTATARLDEVEPLVNWRWHRSSGRSRTSRLSGLANHSGVAAASRRMTPDPSAGRLIAGAPSDASHTTGTWLPMAARAARTRSAASAGSSNGRVATRAGAAPARTVARKPSSAASGDGHATATRAPGVTPPSARWAACAAARRMKWRCGSMRDVCAAGSQNPIDEPSSSAWARAKRRLRRPSASHRAIRSGNRAGAGPRVTTRRNLAAKIPPFARPSSPSRTCTGTAGTSLSPSSDRRVRRRGLRPVPTPWRPPAPVNRGGSPVRDHIRAPPGSTADPGARCPRPPRAGPWRGPWR